MEKVRGEVDEVRGPRTEERVVCRRSFGAKTVQYIINNTMGIVERILDFYVGRKKEVEGFRKKCGKIFPHFPESGCCDVVGSKKEEESVAVEGGR